MKFSFAQAAACSLLAVAALTGCGQKFSAPEEAKPRIDEESCMVFTTEPGYSGVRYDFSNAMKMYNYGNNGMHQYQGFSQNFKDLSETSQKSATELYKLLPATCPAPNFGTK